MRHLASLSWRGAIARDSASAAEALASLDALSDNAQRSRATLPRMTPMYRRAFVLAILAVAFWTWSNPLRADEPIRVRWYETRGITPDPQAELEWSKASYWVVRLQSQVELALFNGGPPPGPERDALLAAVSTWVAGTKPDERTGSVLQFRDPDGKPRWLLGPGQPAK